MTKITTHHDPNPRYYSLTKVELDNLISKSKISAKENTYFCIGIFIPTTLNLIAEFNKASPKYDSAFFLLSGLAVISTALIAFFQIKEWVGAKKDLKGLMDEFNSKPVVDMVYDEPDDALITKILTDEG